MVKEMFHISVARPFTPTNTFNSAHNGRTLRCGTSRCNGHLALGAGIPPKRALLCIEHDEETQEGWTGNTQGNKATGIQPETNIKTRYLSLLRLRIVLLVPGY